MICMRTGSTSPRLKKDTGRLKICTKLRRNCGWTVQEYGNYTNIFFHKYFKVLKGR